jgi:hypothetical protein
MPVRTTSIQQKRAADPRYRELRDRLVAEWRGEAGALPVPHIEEETDTRDHVLHVVVTWDEWADLDAQMRSEIIVDTFRTVKGQEASVDLALAMGLTSAEAGRIRSTARQ